MTSCLAIQSRICRCCLLVLIATCVGGSVPSSADNWPGFRGDGSGHSDETNLPVNWDRSAIAWTTDLDVRGHSSPVVWGDRVFLSGWKGSPKSIDRHVVCLDRQSGKLLWDKKAASGAGESVHNMNSWATPSCVTDGERVIAFFGDGGLHAFSADGDHVWSRELGQFPGSWGVGASPIIVGDLVIQNCDSMGESYLLAVDKETGHDVWRTPRRQKPRGGWSTPLLISHHGKTELVVNGEFGVQSYEPGSGKELWFCSGFNGRGTPMPAWGNGLLYVINGKSGDVYSIEPGGNGDVTESHMRWHTPRRGGRDLPSPLFLDGVVTGISMTGITTGYDSSDGRELFKERLDGKFAGSPVAAGGHIYVASESGEIFVLKAGKTLEIVAKNASPLSDDEIVRSSLAIHDGQLLMRSNRRLYCIGKP